MREQMLTGGTPACRRSIRVPNITGSPAIIVSVNASLGEAGHWDLERIAALEPRGSAANSLVGMRGTRLPMEGEITTCVPRAVGAEARVVPAPETGCSP